MTDYDELLKRLENSWCAGNIEAAAAIRSLKAKLDAVRPRPIAECEDEALVCFDILGGPAWETVFKRQGGWKNNVASPPWPDDTLAIPLKALSALTALATQEQKP